MRRLFSNFARGWPGVGLLLIRIVAGASLILDGVQQFHAGQPMEQVIPVLMAMGDGALLIAGLWTPIAGTFVIAVAAWQIFVLHESPYPGILVAAMGAALALVGPGALSIDARLFGWKRIDLEP